MEKDTYQKCDIDYDKALGVIRLTDDMFMANGFKRCENGWYCPETKGYYIIPSEEATNRSFNYGYGFPFVACRYVYELKRILRNNGANELANNFKTE